MNIYESMNRAFEKKYNPMTEGVKSGKPRYTAARYSRFYYGIIDHELNNGEGLFLRKGPKANYEGPLDKADNKLLLFRSKPEAEDYIKNNLMGDSLSEDLEDEFEIGHTFTSVEDFMDWVRSFE